MTQINRKYVPGEIVYADSNGNQNMSCFGVIVEDSFWLKEALKEEKFEKKWIEHNFAWDKQNLIRVLGTKIFNQSWVSNNPEYNEPNTHEVIRYIHQHDTYVEPANLRSLIELSHVYGGRAFRILGVNNYTNDALKDAQLVYNYLDGRRAEQSKKHTSIDDKFLRMLEKAIPLDK